MNNDHQKQTKLYEDTSLAYKNQDPFFIDFYKYRNAAIEAKALILLGKKQEIILALAKLIDYTVDYIPDYEAKMLKLDTLLKDYNNMEMKEFREDISEIWKDISKQHVAHEILPKPQKETEHELDKEWKQEEHKAIRELKKVQADIFKYAGK